MPYPQKLSEQLILDVAAQIVDDDGLDALLTRTLAQRLAVRPSSLYRYFPDKESLVRAVGARFLEELALEVNRHEGLRAMANAYWRYGVQYPNRYDIIVCRAPDAEQPPAAAKFRVTEPLHELATQCFPDRPLVVARALWSYLHGAVSLRLAWPTRPGLEPDEAFAAGLEAFEQWMRIGVDTPPDR